MLKKEKSTKKVKTFDSKINHCWLKLYAEQCGSPCDDKGVSTMINFTIKGFYFFCRLFFF